MYSLPLPSPPPLPILMQHRAGGDGAVLSTVSLFPHLQGHQFPPLPLQRQLSVKQVVHGVYDRSGFRVMTGLKLGDSGQWSKPTELIQ